MGKRSLRSIFVSADDDLIDLVRTKPISIGRRRSRLRDLFCQILIAMVRLLISRSELIPAS